MEEYWVIIVSKAALKSSEKKQSGFPIVSHIFTVLVMQVNQCRHYRPFYTVKFCSFIK